MQSDFQRRKELRSAIASFLVTLALAISIAIVLYSLYFGQRKVEPVPPIQSSSSIQVLELELEKIRAEMGRLKVAVPVPSGTTTSQLAQELQQATAIIKELDARLTSLEKAILANPAKALELPLIQRDIDGLRLSQQATGVYLKESVDRVYDLNKWLLGGLAVSIITLALSTFVRGRPKGSEQ